GPTIISQIDGGLYDRWLPPRDKAAVIVDIGANVGLFSLHCALPKWRVFAIEPTPGFCGVLGAAISFHTPNVIMCRMAISGHTGDTKLAFGDDNNTTTNHVI